MTLHHENDTRLRKSENDTRLRKNENDTTKKDCFTGNLAPLIEKRYAI